MTSIPPHQNTVARTQRRRPPRSAQKAELTFTTGKSAVGRFARGRPAAAADFFFGALAAPR